MPLQNVRARVALASVAALLSLAVLAAAPPAVADGGGFFTTLGTDTLAAESYVRMDTVLAGTMMVRREKMTITQNYTLWVDKQGNLAKYEMARYAAGTGPGDKPLLHVLVTPMGNGFHEQIHTETAAELHVDSPRNTLIMLDLSFAVWETFAMRAVHGGMDSTAIPMLFANDTTHYTMIVRRIGKDSLRFTSIYGEGRAKIDAQGHILGYAAPGSTQQVVVQRRDNMDLKAFAATFGNRPFGAMSPHDSVRAMVGGATVQVWYSRPAMRGRAIFGGVVPWNTVWRTGAAEATALTTDKDLVIGGTAVPAGSYTLFTLPTPTGWKLIVSKRTKEWGTDYDPTADLARIDMSVTSVAAPVERLTIAITPQGTGASLAVSWDRTVASVPVQVK